MTKEDMESTGQDNNGTTVNNENETEHKETGAPRTELNGAQSNENTSESNSNSPQALSHEHEDAAVEADPDADANAAADADAEADVEESELLERMRGDAVGETMYSRKFILQTLLRLSQQTVLEVELEDDLCKLWDMSIAPEVVTLLLENEAIELIIYAISASEDVRLYEILIGLLGNMCAQVECVEQLTAHSDWVELLLKLSTCMDTCMLLQLMRLYQYIMAHVVSGKEQLAIDFYVCFAACENSAKNLGFILQQSVSDELLLAALKAINAILASCALVEEENAQSDLKLKAFSEVFLVQELCDGVNNAFIRLMRDDMAKQADERDGVATEEQAAAAADANADPDDDETDSHKISCDVEVIQTYLNICTILVQLPEAQLSMDLYVSNIMFCLTRILQFLQQPQQLLPLGERQEEYLEDLAHICSCLKYYYDKDTFSNLLGVWAILRRHVEDYAEYDENDFDDFEDEPRSQYEENAFKLLRLLSQMVDKVDAAIILKDIEEIDAGYVDMFRAALQAEQNKDVLLQRALQRLSTVLNNVAGQAK